MILGLTGFFWGLLGERLYDNGGLNPMTTVCGQIKGAGMGGPGSPDIAWQTDAYVFGKNKEVS